MTRDRADAERLFIEHLSTIDRLLAALSRRYGMCDDDAADFASWVKLRFVESGYDALRKFRGESSVTTYLAVVLAMELREYRVKHWGRWRPSAAARRTGPLAIQLERLMHRDGVPLHHAGEMLRTSGETTLSDRELATVATALPRRAPLRPQLVGENALDAMPSAATAEDAVRAEADDGEHARATMLLQQAVDDLPDEDRLMVRLRFREGLSVADVARAMHVEQKPLYRRVERALAALRARLEAEGVTRETVTALLAAVDEEC